MPQFITVTANPAIDRGFIVPGFQRGDVNRATETRITPGGKGVNAARALKTLGADVKAIGFAGGATGQSLRNELAAEVLAADFVDVSPLETRLAIMILDPDAGTQTVVNEPGPKLDASHLDALEALLSGLIEPGGFVLFCGSLPPGIRQDAYARLVATCSRLGANTLVDSSGRALREAFGSHPSVVKINRKELRELGITILDWHHDGFAVVQEFERLTGARVAVVTDGELGAWVSAGELGVYRASAAKVDVVSAVGSGDSSAAGLAYALSQNPDDIEGAIRLAMACGGANALNDGAGYLTLDQIESVSGKIVTIKVA
jgi:1-phosphofructokinase family hexose kinase